MPTLPGHRHPHQAALPAARRALLLLCAVSLLGAQWLLLGHGHAHGHDHGQVHGHQHEHHHDHQHPHDDDHDHGQGSDAGAHACAICLFKAKGPDLAGLLPLPAEAALPVPGSASRIDTWADSAPAQAPLSPWQARGPPQAA